MTKGQETLQVSKISIDGGTQPRCEINEDLVSEYAEEMKAGVTFPPVVVFFDGVKYWLADGFHRTHAARRAGLEILDADVRQGTKRDAILFSVGANAAHGSRRTNADKRKAVMTLLEDEEWSGWSDREIARHAAVSNRFVSNLRSEIVTVNGSQSDDPPPRTYTTKHGTTATMNTANIGKKKAEPPAESKPQTSEPATTHQAAESRALEPETKDQITAIEPRGAGLQKATEAILILNQISRTDALRDAAFDRVIDWIETNR